MTYQLADNRFMFEVITDSYNFKKYKNYAEQHGLVRDICVLDQLDQEPSNLDDYLKIIQKSELWLYLRAKASGTASTVGKLIKGSSIYPTTEQLTGLWRDKITNKPFEKTHTVRGHMKWGVGYEDPALIHFAVNNNLTVAQVGTIYLPMSYIIKTIDEYLPDNEQDIVNQIIRKIPSLMDEHFLVSPDGLVGIPESEWCYDQLSTEIIGMLEIKCISPFHHVEEDDGTLTWVANMESRQWYNPGEIPFVYITQICMQALSGLHRFNMNGHHTMWFIRWSPYGFSEFKIEFHHLVRMGIVSSLLYLKLKSRITTEDDLPFCYQPDEQELVKLLNKYYDIILTEMTHRYVNHFNLYPEFHLYRKVTNNFKFVVPDD